MVGNLDFSLFTFHFSLFIQSAYGNLDFSLFTFHFSLFLSSLFT